MIIWTRRTSLPIIALFLAVTLGVVLLFLTVLREPVSALVAATGHVLNFNLWFAWTGLVLAVGGVLFGLARLRPADVGLRRSGIGAGLAVVGGFWILTQLVLVAAAGLAAGTIALDPLWARYGVVTLLGFFVAQLVGIALLEEVGFRGFLLPQVFIRLRDGRYRLWTAVLISQGIFALFHIPTRLIVSGLDLPVLALQMVVLTLAGILGVMIYLRTANLYVTVGIHALVNAPLALVAAPLNASVVTVALAIALWVSWPLLQGERLHFRLAAIRERCDVARTVAA